MFVLPVLFGLVLKGVLSKLWVMLNTFQLVNELSILPISVPSNVANVQKESISLINFNPIPKEMVYALVFGEQEDFPDSEGINYPAEDGRLLGDFEEPRPEGELQLTAADVYSSFKDNETASELIVNLKLTRG